MTENPRANDSDSAPRIRVRLYLAGDAPNSVAARANLRSALARCSERAVEIEFIDVLTDPERALLDGVLVTPMLVKIAPSPERRILGNLHDQAAVIAALGVSEVPHD